MLHAAAAAPAEGIDVIVAGNPAFIARLATRHRVPVKKTLKFGAVLTLTPAQLATMAEDEEVGSLSSDQTMRSEMALVTQTTGAAAAWHGAIHFVIPSFQLSGIITKAGTVVAIQMA